MNRPFGFGGGEWDTGTELLLARVGWGAPGNLPAAALAAQRGCAGAAFAVRKIRCDPTSRPI